MNKEQIKTTIESMGWQDIMEVFQEEIINYKIDLEGKDIQTIAVDALGKQKAIKIFNNAIKRLNAITGEYTKSIESFK